MKILYVCHRFPFPPKRGGKIRPFNMIKHFTEQGHQVTVASLVRSATEAEEGLGLREYCDTAMMEKVHAGLAWPHMLALLTSTTPSSNAYFYSRSLKQRIRQAVTNTRFDLIFVHCSSVAQYVEDISNTPKILDFGDMDSQKWLIYSRVRRFPLSLGYRIEGTKLQHAEAALARKFDLCTCTTRAELDTLNSYHTGTPTDWFPNGVDTDFFHLSDQPYSPNTICFIGRMDYYPNQQAVFEFCKTTLPLITERRPGFRLLIVGADPSAAIRRLGKIPGVTVTGSVPDVRPYVHQSTATIAPLKIARGTQNKILESMAMGVPSIISEEAAGGIDAISGDHMLVASSPRDYRDKILRLMDDPGERARLSRAGRERVITHHNWKRSMQKLDSIIERCVARKSVTSLDKTIS